MNLEDEMYKRMGRDYTKHLADAMSMTRDRIIGNIMRVGVWHMKMPKRGRYQVWRGSTLKADRIKHRREALALMKLLMEGRDGDK